MKKKCVFCGRIEAEQYDSEPDIWPIVTFEPLNPVTPGHRLFVYRMHTLVNNSLIVGETMEEANRWAQRREIESYNLILNSGAAASQTIEHMHVHLIPRRPNDGLKLPWTV
jgi:histidine triad (HIT) family protein